MIATAFGWQFSSYLFGESKTYAAEPSAQHLLCDARELSSSLQIPLPECYILADFYEATDGDNWYNTQNNNASWFQNPWTICSWGWYGINSCYYDGMLGKYSIQSLTFPRSRQGNNLNGYIPSSLYSLPRLDSIHITRNPNLVVNLDDMTQSPYAANFVHINVHNNILNGNINNFINMPDLRYLDISCYTDANLDDCTATGDTSFVLSLPRLEALRVGGHAGVVVNLSHLENSPLLTQVYALDSYVEWDLSSLTWATGMQTLDISCWNKMEWLCNVTGNLDALQNMTNLEYLSLDALLNIEGTLDVLYDKVQLRQIDLSHNKVTGTIWAGIGNLTKLDALDLDDNLLEWTLPEEMYNLVLVTRLNLNDNGLVWSLLDFRMFPRLESLNIGSTSMDYSNVWDMLVPEQNPLCVVAAWPWPNPCAPRNSRLKQLSVNSANIQWSLPDVWHLFPDLIELNLQFNKITGPFPPSFEALTNLSEFQIRFNNLDGDIPPYLAAMQLDEGKFAIEANCLNTDVTDPDLLALLTENSPGWNNQLNCRANIKISTETENSSLAAGQCAPYTIHYENLGPQQAINLTIGQAFGDNITASGSVPPYEEWLVGREYGTANDPCYIQATQFGTWPYFAAYEDLLINDSQYDFASIYDLALVLGWFLGGDQFTGAQGTTEFAYVLDNFCPFVFGTSDHYLCLLLFWMDLKEIDDPSCGYGGEPWYVRDLSTVPAGGSGSIQLQICNESEQIEVLSCSDINVDTISENENEEQCSITVESWYCGDDTIDEGEQCDDGNTTSEDGCSATCQNELPEEPQASCWDGIVNLPGEQCDNGSGNNIQPNIPQPVYGQSGTVSYCSNSCITQTISYNGWYCGDNIVNGPEQCDGSNNCNNLCAIIVPPTPTPYCGDDIVNGLEQCDGTANCNANCTLKSSWSRDRQPNITIDYCPDGDFSPSYYDNDCGNAPIIPQHGSADDEWNNLIDSSAEFSKEVARITKSMQCNIRNELVQAYVFAFDLKVTTVNNICNANLEGEVTREAFAKFITTYAMTVLGKKPDTTRKCVFGDMSKTTAEMQTFARLSCESEIMGLKRTGEPDSMFRPKDFMTRAEIFTALNRLVNGNQDNSATGLRYAKHMNRLAQQKIVLDTTHPERKTLRGEVLLMLMRAYTVIKNR
jgi:cysteine-rich repeat protein